MIERWVGSGIEEPVEPRNRAERRAQFRADRRGARAYIRRARQRRGVIPAFPMRTAFKGILPRPIGSIT